MKRRLASLIIIMAIALQMASVPVAAAALQPLYEKISMETLTQGLVYEKKERLTREGWVDIHVLRMDLEDELLTLELLQNVGEYGVKSTVQQLMDQEERRIVAGVNGSFFDTTLARTDAIGMNYDGSYYSVVHGYNGGFEGAASLVLNEGGSVFFDFINTKVTLYTDRGQELAAAGYNRQPKNGGLIVYDRAMGETTQAQDSYADLYKLVVAEGVVQEVLPPKQSADIPEDGFVLAVPASVWAFHQNSFTVGTYVEAVVDTGIDEEELALALSGGGKILENGAIVQSGLVIDPKKRHPRTAIGLAGDGSELIAMVIDGRGQSIGATHEELAGYLLEYGATDAIHMDGGGSSTLVGTGYGETASSLFNRPSDGSQRRVLNGLGFATLAPENGPVAELVLEANHSKVFKNSPIVFRLKALDAYGNGLPVDEDDLAWSVQGLTGKWNGSTFVPASSGIGKVTVYYGRRSASMTVQAVDAYIDIDVEPKILRLEEGGTGSFTFMGTDATGFKGVVEGRNIAYGLADSSLGTFADGVFHAGMKPGISKVTFQVGTRSLSAFVVVGDDTHQVAGFEEKAISPLGFPETVTAAALLASDRSSEGPASYRLDYSFEPSMESQAAYLVFEDLVFDNPINGLVVDVYSTGSGHMARAMLTDAAGKKVNVTLAGAMDWTGWKTLEVELPDDLVFPAELNRLYVAALQAPKDYSGTVHFDNLKQRIDFSTEKLQFDVEQLIADPLMAAQLPSEGYRISLFGATAGRNRLLDDIVLSKVYKAMAGSTTAVFAGGANIDKTQLPGQTITWGNTFANWDTPDVKIISLATGGGGLYKTDYTQYEKLKALLANTSQNNILVLANKNPVEEGSFTDAREGELLHEILSSFGQKTGKHIFYVDASGYNFNVDIRDGVRYLDLNGLWYTVGSGRTLDLNRTFYTVDFHVVDHELRYKVNNLYPLVAY